MPSLAALVEAFGRRIEQHNRATAARLQKLYRVRGNVFDPEWSAGRAVDAALVVAQGQDAVAATVDAYAEMMLRETGAARRPVAPRRQLESFLRGDAPEAHPLVEWERPQAQFRRLVTDGLVSVDEAFAQMEERALQQASFDTKLAETHRFRDNLTAQKTDLKFFRVPRPEESKAGVCGLCIAASTQYYSTDQLLPIHGGCNCVVAAATDKALEWARQDRMALYKRIGKTASADLLRVRVQVDEHGEYGPILTPKTSRSQSRSEPAREQRKPGQPRPLEWVVAERKALMDKLPGVTDPRPREWLETRVAALTEEIKERS